MNRERLSADEKKNAYILLTALLASAFFILFCRAEPKKAQESYAEQRKEMVRVQLERRGISDERVLQAMREVPRHLFIDERYRHLAYADHPLPIDAEQTISQPYIVGLMTEVIEIEKGEDRKSTRLNSSHT